MLSSYKGKSHTTFGLLRSTLIKNGNNETYKKSLKDVSAPKKTAARLKAGRRAPSTLGRCTITLSDK